MYEVRISNSGGELHLKVLPVRDLQVVDCSQVVRLDSYEYLTHLFDSNKSDDADIVGFMTSEDEVGVFGPNGMFVTFPSTEEMTANYESVIDGHSETD